MSGPPAASFEAAAIYADVAEPPAPASAGRQAAGCSSPVASVEVPHSVEEIANPVTIVDDPVIPEETPSPLSKKGFHAASAHVTFRAHLCL